MSNTGHRDLCTDAATALWRLCREGGFAAAQAAVKRLGLEMSLEVLERFQVSTVLDSIHDRTSILFVCCFTSFCVFLLYKMLEVASTC